MKSPPHETAARNALRSEVPRFMREAVLLGLAVFLLTAVAVMVVYRGAVKNKYQEAIAVLRPQAEYLASLVDARAHAWLTQPQQTNSQPYNVLTQRLQNVRSFYPAWGRVFTGRYQNGKILIILDTHDPKRGAAGHHYVARPLNFDPPPDAPEIQAIRNHQAYSSDKPLFKGPGNFLGVIVPLPSSTASADDFLYLDASSAPLEAGLASTKNALDVSLVAAALLAAILGVSVFSWRCESFHRHVLTVNQLRESEELFRGTYELSPVAMYLTGTDGHILRANEAFCRLLGYQELDLMDLTPADYLLAGDARDEQPLLRDPQDRAASQYQAERRYRRKDGQTVWGIASIAIVRDSEANISYYLVQVVDITERKQAETARHMNEERLALAADAGRVGMWDCDLKTRTVVWNDVMHAIHETDPVAFCPTPAAQEQFILEEDRAAVAAEFERCMNEGRPCEQEYRIRTARGEIRHVKARTSTFRDEHGHPIRAVGTHIDVTAERQEADEIIRAKESALAADKAKSEFLAMMSHEIRTPLNGVLGFVSILKKTPLDSEQMSYIDTMESSGQGLLALVNDILDLSKMEACDIHVEPTLFDVRPFIRRIHEQLGARAAEKRLQYDFSVEYSVPKAIQTDAMRLGQILTNMLGNAVKFTDAGSVELHVGARPIGLFQKNWEWRFAVRDSGPGIPQDALANLFQLFYQVDSSATRRHGGTGLGLAISQRLARLLGGEITVRSEVGRGTEFTLTITAPRGPTVNALGQVVPPKPIELSPVDFQDKRILVVEDNPVNRKLCALQLRRLGCQADFAVTGSEAVEKVRRGGFHAVLMDMQLPDLDGCDATREIRREEKTGERLSIIALTANAMPEDKKKCLDAGMDDFLSKPLQYETLASTLSKWV